MPELYTVAEPTKTPKSDRGPPGWDITDSSTRATEKTLQGSPMIDMANHPNRVVLKIARGKRKFIGPFGFEWSLKSLSYMVHGFGHHLGTLDLRAWMLYSAYFPLAWAPGEAELTGTVKQNP